MYAVFILLFSFYVCVCGVAFTEHFFICKFNSKEIFNRTGFLLIRTEPDIFGLKLVPLIPEHEIANQNDSTSKYQTNFIWTDQYYKNSIKDMHI